MIRRTTAEDRRVTFRQVKSERVELDKLKIAHAHGYATGLANKHETQKNFCTSDEWIEWLAGWRAAQSQRKTRLEGCVEDEG